MTRVVAAVTLILAPLAGCGDRTTTTPQSALSPTGPASQAITIGYIDWDEAVAVSWLWKNSFESQGYHVKLEKLDVGELYAGVYSGKLDLFLDAWLPSTQGFYWSRFGSGIVDLGTWFAPADIGLAVPSYVAVDSLADLAANPGLFDRKIIGIEPSSGEMNTLKNFVMSAYGLTAYTVVDGTTPDMIAELTRAIAAKEPIVVTLWRPHWAFTKFPLKVLADPKKAFGEPDKINMLASKSFVARHPELAEQLKGFSLTSTQLGSLEILIHDGGPGGESAAVKTWMKANPGVPGP